MQLSWERDIYKGNFWSFTNILLEDSLRIVPEHIKNMKKRSQTKSYLMWIWRYQSGGQNTSRAVQGGDKWSAFLVKGAWPP